MYKLRPKLPFVYSSLHEQSGLNLEILRQLSAAICFWPKVSVHTELKRCANTNTIPAAAKRVEMIPSNPHVILGILTRTNGCDEKELNSYIHPPIFSAEDKQKKKQKYYVFAYVGPPRIFQFQSWFFIRHVDEIRFPSSQGSWICSVAVFPLSFFFTFFTPFLMRCISIR